MSRIGDGGVDYSLEMSLPPVVDIGSAEMSDSFFVCVLGAPALIVAAFEAPNSTESLDEVFEKGAK